MTVYCLGSINIDNFYRLPSLPRPWPPTPMWSAWAARG